MHIATYLCCDLFGLLGGDLLALCFQGKKTRTLDGKKMMSTTTYFSESLTALCLLEVERHPPESSHCHKGADT